MAILDAELELSSAQDVSGTGDDVSTNTWDTVVAEFDPGPGQQLVMRVGVQTAITGGTSVTVVLIDSANADLSSHTELMTLGVFTSGSAPAGTEFEIPFPFNKKTARYVGFDYQRSGTISAGAVDAHIALVVDTWKAYPDNITIS